MTDKIKVNNSRLDQSMREFFVNRIIAGYLKYSIGGLSLQIRYPKPQIRYEACEIYEEYLEKGESYGLLSTEEILNLMQKLDLWTPNDEKKIEILPQHIETFKIEIYKNVYNKELLDRNKSHLKVAEKELNKIRSKKHMYDHISIDGVATYAKHVHMIANSVFHNDKKYNWEHTDPHAVLNYYYTKMIPDTLIRLLSHTSPWDSIWNTSGPYIFSSDPTLEQQRLVNWTKMYDSVYESIDRPIDRVIDDDDMLDGWLILQKRKRREEDKKRFNEQKFTTSGKGQEVFILAKSQEEANEIYSMNTPTNRSKIKRRLAQIQRDGQVKEADLSDVKRDLQMQANRLSREKIKGR